MKKTLLILGASQDQLFMIRTARRMGLKTISLDRNPSAPGFVEADEHAVVSTRDLPAIFDFTNQYREHTGPIDGVSTMGSDIPHIVSAVAAHLGTPAISALSAQWATNKYEMKERFSQAGVRVPWYQLVDSAELVRKIIAERGGPMVLKPVDQAGSRGVSLVRYTAEADDLFAHALNNSSRGQVLLESFVPGPQISTESLMLDGEIYTPGYADRNYDHFEDFLPQIMENGGWVPSIHEEQRGAVEAEVKKAAIALEITDGVVKGDVVLGSDGPVIIEIAARLSGGDFSESLVPLGTGVNYVESVIQLAIGERPDPCCFEARFQKAVANRYFFAPAGILRKVYGLDKVLNQEWLAKMELWYQPGDRLPSIRSHGQRTGVFVITGENRKIVQERIDWVYGQVRCEVEPII